VGVCCRSPPEAAPAGRPGAASWCADLSTGALDVLGLANAFGQQAEGIEALGFLQGF